jgi:hypothetical protein
MGTLAVQSTSAYFLIHSIVTIKNYLEEKGAAELINTRAMLTHGTAFVLYIAALVLVFGMAVPYSL